MQPRSDYDSGHHNCGDHDHGSGHHNCGDHDDGSGHDECSRDHDDPGHDDDAEPGSDAVWLGRSGLRPDADGRLGDRRRAQRNRQPGQDDLPPRRHLQPHPDQHVAGIKVYALHQYQAKIFGWIETYAPGDEWHGVYVDNSINNPTGQGLQVYADDFVFVDSIFTNHLLSGGFFLGSPSYGIARNVLIARNKIFQVGKQPEAQAAHTPSTPVTRPARSPTTGSGTTSDSGSSSTRTPSASASPTTSSPESSKPT